MAKTAANVPSMKKHYLENVRPELQKEFGYSSPM